MRLAEALKDPAQVKQLQRMSRADHEQPTKSADGYEQRLSAIVRYCQEPKSSKQIAQEFGYASGASAYAPIHRLLTERRLTKLPRKNLYQSLVVRTLKSDELLERNLASWTERYHEALEADAKSFTWEMSADVQIMKDFLEFVRSRHAD